MTTTNAKLELNWANFPLGSSVDVLTMRSLFAPKVTNVTCPPLRNGHKLACTFLWRRLVVLACSQAGYSVGWLCVVLAVIPLCA